MKEYEITIKVENDLGEESIIKRYYVLPIQDKITLKQTIDELLKDDYALKGYKIINYNVDNF